MRFYLVVAPEVAAQFTKRHDGIVKNEETTKMLLKEFLDKSTSPYHAVHEVRELLDAAGFLELEERDSKNSKGNHYIINDGSLIAWITPDQISSHNSFSIAAGHTDSPNLRLKPVLKGEQFGLKQFGIEVYGGSLLNTWLDRDLGISGRIVTSKDGALTERLIKVDKALCRIPQLAIHLDRNVNEKGLTLNPHDHLRPIWSDTGSKFGTFSDFITKDFVEKNARLESWDLMLHDIQPAQELGMEKQWISSGRIDNLVTCHAAVSALIMAKETTLFNQIPMICLFNHEEVGSVSSTGAASNFLPSVIDQICQDLTLHEKHILLRKSKLVSADGAHATHPNYPDRHDLDHKVQLNGGIAIKRNSNERYATTAKGQAFAQSLCREIDVPFQIFSNRSDMSCGSTIGPVASARLGIETIDMGVPQLAMHSSREICGLQDVKYLERFLVAFFTSKLSTEI